MKTSLALVQNQVNSALAQLPGEVQQGVNVKKVSTNILLVVSLYSEDNRFDEAFLSNYGVINMQYPLARLPGVGQVRVFGAGPYSMRVWLDPNRLKQFNLTTHGRSERHQGPECAGRGRAIGRSSGACRTRLFSSPSTAWAGSPMSDQFENIIVKSDPGQSCPDSAPERYCPRRAEPAVLTPTLPI